MDEKEINEAITGFVLGELGGAEEVAEIEDNCGTMWITTKDGKVYAVSIMETEAPE